MPELCRIFIRGKTIIGSHAWPMQWRRKMLVVRGAVSVAAHIASAKIFRPHPLFVKITPILSIRCCWARVYCL